ncbi:MAG: DegV family protein [Acidobacteriota bacterium]|nr:DegV family protein [Acidobacteriota bacterium]
MEQDVTSDVVGGTDPLDQLVAPDDVSHVGRAYHRKRTCKIIVDSPADFAPAVADRLGVRVIPFSYVTPEGEFVDDMWATRDPHDFYEFMRKNPDLRITTAAVTPGRYMEVFEEEIAEGLPILYLGFTGGLSSSIDSARQAAEAVMASHPESKIYVLDNLCPSLAGQLLAIEVVRQAAEGLTPEELHCWAKDARYFVQGYFTLDSLHWLSLGGRIPPTAANVGGKLDIKPELTYDRTGALSLRGMCRGRKKALRAILQDFRENYGHDRMLPIGIASADAEKDADWLEAQIRKEKGCEDVVIMRSSISPVIGCHVGPGMVAVAFWGSDRREKLSLTDRIARKVRGA